MMLLKIQGIRSFLPLNLDVNIFKRHSIITASQYRPHLCIPEAAPFIRTAGKCSVQDINVTLKVASNTVSKDTVNNAKAKYCITQHCMKESKKPCQTGRSPPLREQYSSPFDACSCSDKSLMTARDEVADTSYSKDYATKMDKNVQTENIPCDILSIVNTAGLSDLFHKINLLECDSAPNSDTVPHTWVLLSKLNYSPALFNLGLWHHRRGSRTAVPLQLKYSPSGDHQEAERCYATAILLDEHPAAAYNLACLLMETRRSVLTFGSSVFSISHLMKLAATGGICLARTDSVQTQPSEVVQ